MPNPFKSTLLYLRSKFTPLFKNKASPTQSSHPTSSPTPTSYAKPPQPHHTLNPSPYQPPLDNTSELLRQQIAHLSPTVARLFPHLVSNNHIAFLLQALAVQISVGIYNAPKHPSPEPLLEAWTLTVHETLNELHRIHSFCSQHPLSNPTPQIEAILTETANTLSWLATSGLPTFLQTRSYSPYQPSRL